MWEKVALCSMPRSETGCGADLEVQGKGRSTDGNCESVDEGDNPGGRDKEAGLKDAGEWTGTGVRNVGLPSSEYGTVFPRVQWVCDEVAWPQGFIPGVCGQSRTHTQRYP